MSAPLVVKLSVEGIRAQLLAALSPDMIRETLEAEVDRAIASFDFDGYVRQETQRLLQETITASIRSALCSVTVLDPKARAAIVERFRKALEAEGP